MIVLKNAEPDRLYKVHLVEGPTHAQATGTVDIWTITTDGNGYVQTTIIVSVAALQSEPLGSGEHTDHIDMLGETYPSTSGAYVVTGVNYYVPQP